MSFKNKNDIYASSDVSVEVPAAAIEAATEALIKEEPEVKGAPEKEVVAEPPKASIPQIARIKVDLCNVRREASASADIVKVVTKGAEFKVDSAKSTGSYVAVSVEGTVAFVRSDLVEVFDNPAYAANELAMKVGSAR